MCRGVLFFLVHRSLGSNYICVVKTAPAIFRSPFLDSQQLQVTPQTAPLLHLYYENILDQPQHSPQPAVNNTHKNTYTLNTPQVDLTIFEYS